MISTLSFYFIFFIRFRLRGTLSLERKSQRGNRRSLPWILRTNIPITVTDRRSRVTTKTLIRTGEQECPCLSCFSFLYSSLVRPSGLTVLSPLLSPLIFIPWHFHSENFMRAKWKNTRDVRWKKGFVLFLLRISTTLSSFSVSLHCCHTTPLLDEKDGQKHESARCGLWMVQCDTDLKIRGKENRRCLLELTYCNCS